MGIAFLVMWPVLYTDTSEAWKLSSRRQRMAIGVAGIAAELALAAIATLVWSFLPDGPMRGGVFLLATSTWVLTIAINASPFTRFDGYFLLSDWLNLPNLHERIFALARWWLREKLFGLGDPAPEEIPAGRRRGLILLAFVTATYRLVLFVSIALLVGHVFFKALGIVLMTVEIGFFVVLPILREVSVWWHRRANIRFNLPTLRTLFALAIILGIFLIPWRATISLPAVLQNAEAQGVYARHSGRIEMLGARNGAVVSAGDMLVELSSPELSQDRDTARVTAETLAQQVRQQPFDSVQQAEGVALQRSWEAAQRHLAGAEAALGELKLKAMFSGRVVEMPNGLAEGSWVKRGELLMRVLGDGGINGEAFLSEADLGRANSGVQARFIPDMLETPEIPCRIAGIDPINLATLSQPVLASLYGGSIPARPNANGTLEPLHAIYRVRLVDCALDGVLATELSGRAVVAGSADPIGLAFWRGLVSWLRRELSV
jgi:putative peptide zinc metalloprotease protein